MTTIRHSYYNINLYYFSALCNILSIAIYQLSFLVKFYQHLFNPITKLSHLFLLQNYIVKCTIAKTCHKCCDKTEPVCYQSETECGEVGNSMQSVSDNTAMNCVKQLKITHLSLSGYRNSHLSITVLLSTLPALLE